MIIFIEGPDRVGKDSLIKNLKNHYSHMGFMEMHFSSVKNYTENKAILFNTNLFKVLKNNPDINFILNRSHLGELVYAPLFRDYSGEFVLNLENKINLDNCFLITLIDSPDILSQREDGESPSSDTTIISQIIERFKDATNRSKIKHKIIIDCHNKTKDEVLAKAVSFINVI